MDWADLGPTETNIPFWARPDPEGRAGPGSAWPSNQNGRGELFSPHPCMQNAIRSACREEKNKYENERVEELPGAGVAVACCVSGGAVAEAGGGVWAHGRRLQAAAAALCFLVFSRDSPPGLFSSNFQLFLPLPMFRSSFFLPFPLFSRSVLFLFSVFLFSLLSVSLFFGSLSPFLLFSGFLPFFSSPFPQRSWVLFIEPRAWLFTALMGSSRLVGHWARLLRFGPPPRFSGRCAVGGRPVCSVGGLQAREGPEKNSNKSPFFPSSPLQCLGGKKKEEQCRSKRHRSAPSLFPFFFECMKRRRFGENAPFHLNVASECAKFQISP